MNALRRFMAGRNGVDELFYFCFISYLVLYGLNFLIIGFSYIGAAVVYYSQLAIIAITVFRILSKNLPKRRAENEKFLAFITKLFPNFELNVKRVREGRGYKFHKCKKCGSILRFPKKKGTFNVTCPKCGNQFLIKHRF